MRREIRLELQKIISFFQQKLSRENKVLPFYLLILAAFVVFIIGINVFVELTDQLSGESLKNYDQSITDFVISYRSPFKTRFFQVISVIGDFYGYVVSFLLISIFLFMKFRNAEFILQLCGVVILSALSNLALKKVINRARPTIEHIVVVNTLSYPSGHSMGAMAFYGFIIYLLFQIKMARFLRGVLCVFFMFLILSIGVSRIYLGVHFPSDVAGGFIAGLIWVAFCIVLYNIIFLYRRQKVREHKVPTEENLE